MVVGCCKDVVEIWNGTLQRYQIGEEDSQHIFELI